MPNALSEAVSRARASGVDLYDLTETNPTRVQLPYPDLSDAFRGTTAVYQPEAAGLPAARELVAAAYREAGVGVDASQVVLTASTSEAYSLLFKLLCEPGDEVLVPQPSYPLFDLLTGLDAVVSTPYRLDPDGAWCVDRASVAAALTPRTRAVLVVSPNNPTGSVLRASDREWLVALAASRGLALIADEVFAAYPLAPRPERASLCGEARALTFALGGLSKSAGLPQMKLGWIVVSGPAAIRAEALARLEIIADTYLSVSTPVQHAAAALMAAGRDIQRAIHARIRRNLRALADAVRARPDVTLLEPEAGWSAILRVPAILSEEQLVLRLLEDSRVLVHPGYFFDFASEAYLVSSLLPAPDRFDAGAARLLAAIGGA